MNDLDWTGVESVTLDTYYDICQGYYSGEIKDEYTKKKLDEAIRVISSLENHLQENELVG